MRRLALLALAAVTACGSTVQLHGTATVDGLGSSAPGTSQDGSTPLGAGATGPGGSATRSAGLTGPATSAAVEAAQPGPAAAVASVPATSARAPITLGVPYVDQSQSSAFTNSVGKGLATGDTKAATVARVAWVNAHGGILGHKLVAYYQALDATSSPAQYQAVACAAFTQDHKVQYVVDMGLGDTFLACMAKAGVGVISTTNSFKTAAGMARFPGYVQPDALNLDRNVRAQASQFLAMGFYGNLKTTRVGILYYDHPEFAAAEKLLEKELADRGITVAARQAITYVDAESKVPQAVSEANNAVLKFRSAGVTHVLAVEENAWLTGGFGIAASSQSYYPRYGYTSQEPLGNIASNVPAAELKGALFLGWDPVSDVPDLSQLTPAGKACLRFFRQQPQDTPNERGALMTACESIDFLKAAITAAGRADGAPSLVAGASRLSGYASAYTFQVGLSTTRRDGVVAYRPGKWDDACGCFTYTGPQRDVPA